MRVNRTAAAAAAAALASATLDAVAAEVDAKWAVEAVTVASIKQEKAAAVAVAAATAVGDAVTSGEYGPQGGGRCDDGG